MRVFRDCVEVLCKHAGNGSCSTEVEDVVVCGPFWGEYWGIALLSFRDKRRNARWLFTVDMSEETGAVLDCQIHMNVDRLVLSDYGSDCVRLEGKRITLEEAIEALKVVISVA